MRIKDKIACLTVILSTILALFTPVNSSAQNKQSQKEGFKITYLAVEILPITENGVSGGELTPEYAWRYNNFSGFGFFEMRKERPWFTNHNIHYTLPSSLDFISIGTEQGGVPHNGSRSSFIQGGAKIQMTKVPFIGKSVNKVFKNLTVGHYRKIAGRRVPNETLIAWNTRSLKINTVQIYSDGFIRLRGGDRPDYGQPQLWLKFAQKGLWSRLAFGAQAEISGGNVTWLFGSKVYIR